MSRPSIVFCLVGCDQKNDQKWRGSLRRAGCRGPRRSGVVQKDVQGCVVEQRGGRRRCDVLLSNLRAPRFWPSDVVCGGGGNWEGLGPGEEGTSSTAAPPLVCILLLGVGLKILHRPSPFLASSRASPVGQSDSPAGRPGRPGRAGLDGCLSGLHSRSHLISSNLYVVSPSLHSLPILVQTWS